MNNPYLNGCGCKAWELKTHERCDKEHLCKECIHDAEIFKEGVALTLKDEIEWLKITEDNSLQDLTIRYKELKQRLKELE